jgi:hypothetical protein
MRELGFNSGAGRLGRARPRAVSGSCVLERRVTLASSQISFDSLAVQALRLEGKMPKVQASKSGWILHSLLILEPIFRISRHFCAQHPSAPL